MMTIYDKYPSPLVITLLLLLIFHVFLLFLLLLCLLLLFLLLLLFIFPFLAPPLSLQMKHHDAGNIELWSRKTPGRNDSGLWLKYHNYNNKLGERTTDLTNLSTLWEIHGSFDKSNGSLFCRDIFLSSLDENRWLLGHQGLPSWSSQGHDLLVSSWVRVETPLDGSRPGLKV